MFHEDLKDALRHLVAALGGFEAVGVELFPNKNRRGAGSWLSDCLNSERPAKLDLDEFLQLLRMGRDQEVHDAINWICDQAGYAHPQPVTPQNQEARIAQQLESIAKSLTVALDRYEKFQEQAKAIRAVK